MISEQTTDTWMVVIIFIFGNIIFLIVGKSWIATITILALYQGAVFPLNQSKKQKPGSESQKGKNLPKGIKPKNAAHRNPQEFEPQTEKIQERKLPRSSKNIPKPEKTVAQPLKHYLKRRNLSLKNLYPKNQSRQILNKRIPSRKTLKKESKKIVLIVGCLCLKYIVLVFMCFV